MDKTPQIPHDMEFKDDAEKEKYLSDVAEMQKKFGTLEPTYKGPVDRPEVMALQARIAELELQLAEARKAAEAARPYIKAMAEWESKEGTLAGIMPCECDDFCRPLARLAVTESPRQVMTKIDAALAAKER